MQLETLLCDLKFQTGERTLRTDFLCATIWGLRSEHKTLLIHKRQKIIIIINNNNYNNKK